MNTQRLKWYSWYLVGLVAVTKKIIVIKIIAEG